MALTLMYITNNPKIAAIAQRAGVDRIWVDMEYIGKEVRQAGMNTVKSFHTVDDIKALRPIVTSSELLVRINPIHDATNEYCSTEQEIEDTISAGADVIMLPMFKNALEVSRFIRAVNGRAKTILLFETAESVENIDDILSIEGIDEVHIGLNDLHLACKKTFMFELLCDGTVEKLCKKFANKGIKYGFGGIARIGYGMLPAEYIIAEHYRLSSQAAILSRSFCNADKIENTEMLYPIFSEAIKDIRAYEKKVFGFTSEDYHKNQQTVISIVDKIVGGLNGK